MHITTEKMFPENRRIRRMKMKVHPSKRAGSYSNGKSLRNTYCWIVCMKGKYRGIMKKR